MNTATSIRELEPREVESLSGGNPLVGIGIGATIGGIGGALGYAYGISVNGGEFSWGGFAGETIQGAITGALAGTGGFLFTVDGAAVAAVSAEGLATIVHATDPAQSLQ